MRFLENNADFWEGMAERAQRNRTMTLNRINSWCIQFATSNATSMVQQTALVHGQGNPFKRLPNRHMGNQRGSTQHWETKKGRSRNKSRKGKKNRLSIRTANSIGGKQESV